MTTRERIEERWDCATRDVERFAGEATVSQVNSKRWERINDGLEELAAFLIEEAGDDELTALLSAPGALWEVIHDTMVTWAVSRADGRRGVVAA